MKEKKVEKYLESLKKDIRRLEEDIENENLIEMPEDIKSAEDFIAWVRSDNLNKK